MMILFTCFFFRRPDSDPFRGNGGIEMPMGTFMQYTKVPIVVYYGDNLPERDECPELWRAACV